MSVQYLGLPPFELTVFLGNFEKGKQIQRLLIQQIKSSENLLIYILMNMEISLYTVLPKHFN